MSIQSRISQGLTPILNDLGYDLVRVMVSGKKDMHLQIMIDHLNETPITVDDCAHVSRSVSTFLNVENILPKSSYRLEVSSPGVNRPLTREKDFHRFRGQNIKASTRLPVDGQKRFQGILHNVDQNGIEMQIEQKPLFITWDNLYNCELIPHFF